MPPSPKHSADHLLLLTFLGLILFGFIMVASASAVIATRFHQDQYFFLKHQLLYGGLFGLFTFAIGFFVPYHFWRKLALPGIIAALIMLTLVFVPAFNFSAGGASRWISIGPITIQPTEITKLIFIIYLAALMEKKGEDVKNFSKSVIPFLVISTVICVLVILQPDMGTLISISLIACAMVFIAGFQLRHLLIIFLAGAAAFSVFINTADYRLDRILVYLHPELDPQGIGYQINQALLAVGTGGLWGQGLGRSRQKYYYLPEPAGDSIFAIIAEELGLFRSLLLLSAYTFIATRGYAIARNSPDIFGKLIATGITSWIAVQAFINIGSILGVSPLTGIPLPFISYGGSSLATLMFASGILLNISKYTELANS